MSFNPTSSDSSYVSKEKDPPCFLLIAITSNTEAILFIAKAAIATFLSCGKPLKKSCELGTKYVNQAIGSNINYGKGHGPINHLNSILIDKKFR